MKLQNKNIFNCRHLPAYMVASFVKRVSRLCLSAPVACLEPMLMLIRNLLVRHQSVRVLLHRDSPGFLSSN